jgi:uncharacterized protein (DUF433 family)
MNDPERPYKKISCDPGYLGGSPRITGTRISVELITRSIGIDGDSVEQTADDYGVDIESVHEALCYCSGRFCVTDDPQQYCDWCSLGENPLDLAQIIFDKDGTPHFNRNSQSGVVMGVYSIPKFGIQDCWKIAQEACKKLEIECKNDTKKG